MKLSSFSVRYQAIFFISLMGIVALALVVGTALTYRHFTWQSHEQAYQSLAEYEKDDVLAALGQNSFDLAIKIQHGKAFREKWQQNNWSELVDELNDQFNQYYFTAGVIPISKLQVFDLAFNLLAESTEGGSALSPGMSVCSRLIDQAKRRKGADRLKSLSQLCLMSGKPQFATLAPIGGLHVKGYILVASDPASVLEQLEPELGMPIRLSDARGSLLYSSSAEKYATEGFYLPVNYQVFTNDGNLAYQVLINVDISDFDQQTQNVFVTVLVLAFVVTLSVVLLAILVMRRTIVFPLEQLSKHLAQVRDDNRLLEKPITVKGNKEVYAVAEAFNQMSGELSLLQKRLTDMAYTDSLTGAANRLKFNHFLERQTGRKRRSDTNGFALLIIDLNKFKEVNDKYGHDVGDRLLLAVVQRMKSVVRESDMVARLGGDEFAVILPGMIDKTDIGKLIQKMLEVTQKPLEANEIELRPSLSIGVSLFPETSTMLKALLKSADHAMYRAKKSGDGYRIAKPCPDDCDDCLDQD